MNDGPVRSVEVIRVIRTTAVMGEGVHSDPARAVDQYWTTEGALLFTRDYWKEQQEAEA